MKDGVLSAGTKGVNGTVGVNKTVRCEDQCVDGWYQGCKRQSNCKQLGERSWLVCCWLVPRV